jgi:hypothetical protein
MGSGKQPVGKIAMVGVLMIAFGLVLVMALRQPSASKAGQAPADPQNDPAIAKKAADIPTWTMPEPYPVGLRDPMVLVEAPKPVEETTLEVLKRTCLIKGVVLGRRAHRDCGQRSFRSAGQGQSDPNRSGEVEFEKTGSDGSDRGAITAAPDPSNDQAQKETHGQGTTTSGGMGGLVLTILMAATAWAANRWWG